MNEQFVATVEAALARAEALRAGGVLLVALSGGADSVALLSALCALRARHGLTVRAAHVEHGLRGEASLADAAFCEALCARLAVPFTCDRAGLAGGMDAPGAEARAREARYALLLARAREANADALLLAHHRDDQAETVLARLIRGSGARGLSGMRETSLRGGVRIVRPLLALSKADILAALDGAPYREDESNARPCCQRNRLRAEVLPLLAAENPRAAEHIAQSAALLALDEACLMAQAEALLDAALWAVPPLLCVRREMLAAAPPAVAVRALRAFAERGYVIVAAGGAIDSMAGGANDGANVGTDGRANVGTIDGANVDTIGHANGGETCLSGKDTLALLALLAAPNGQALNLPRGLYALSCTTHLHLLRMAGGAPVTPKPVPAPLPLAGLHALTAPRMLPFGAFSFVARPFDPAADPPPDGVTAVAVPLSALPKLAFRTARGGERITRFGAGGGKPLRRYLTDQKLDPPFRPVLPLLCAGDAVWWAAGVGAGEQTRLGGEPALLIRLACAPPWLPVPNQPASCAEIHP